MLHRTTTVGYHISILVSSGKCGGRKSGFRIRDSARINLLGVADTRTAVELQLTLTIGRVHSGVKQSKKPTARRALTAVTRLD
jgi:hypothetical protein